MDERSLANIISGKKFLASGIKTPLFVSGNECCDYYWDYIKHLEFTFVRKVDYAIYKNDFDKLFEDLRKHGLGEEVAPLTKYSDDEKYAELDLMYRKYLMEVSEYFKTKANEIS